MHSLSKKFMKLNTQNQITNEHILIYNYTSRNLTSIIECCEINYVIS